VEKRLKLDQENIVWPLEQKTYIISGNCNYKEGDVVVRMDSDSMESSCPESGEWTIELDRDVIKTTLVNVQIELSQKLSEAPSIKVDTTKESESSVCDNVIESEINARGLDTTCFNYRVTKNHNINELDIETALDSATCIATCPVLTEAKELEFSTLSRGVKINNDKLGGSNHFTLFFKANWTGSTTLYGGKPASVILEKGLDDDDNYGVYVWDRNICMEYRTTSNVRRAHCVSGVIDQNKDFSFAAVVNIDETKIDFYIDGELQKTVAEKELLKTNNHPLVLGEQNYARYPFGFQGKLWDMNIQQRVLSAAEIKALNQ
jgi:hypothetical protein